MRSVIRIPENQWLRAIKELNAVPGQIAGRTLQPIYVVTREHLERLEACGIQFELVTPEEVREIEQEEQRMSREERVMKVRETYGRVTTR